MSWLLQRDVNGGRRHLNFTEWNMPQQHAKDVTEEVKGGDMPPWYYTPAHLTARLSPEDVTVLVEWAKSQSPR